MFFFVVVVLSFPTIFMFFVVVLSFHRIFMGVSGGKKQQKTFKLPVNMSVIYHIYSVWKFGEELCSATRLTKIKMK